MYLLQVKFGSTTILSKYWTGLAKRQQIFSGAEG